MIQPMRAATIAILIDKAHFEPETAIAVAEAIETGIREEELVTVPVLKSHLAELRTDLEGKIGGLETKMEARFGALETKMEARSGALEMRFGALETKTADNKAELVRWMFASMMGQVAMFCGIMYFLLQTVR